MKNKIEFLRYKNGFLIYRENEEIKKISLFSEKTKKIFIINEQIFFSEEENSFFTSSNPVLNKFKLKREKNINIKIDKKNRNIKVSRYSDSKSREYEVIKKDYKIIHLKTFEEQNWVYKFTLTKNEIKVFFDEDRNVMLIDKNNNTYIGKIIELFNLFESTTHFYSLQPYKQKLAIREMLISCNCDLNLLKLKVKLIQKEKKLK